MQNTVDAVLNKNAFTNTSNLFNVGKKSYAYSVAQRRNISSHREVLEEHRNVIMSQDINRPLCRQVNRQIGPNFTYGYLKSLINEVVRTEVGALRVNIGFRVVLYHVVQQEYRYFYISTDQ